MKKVFCTAVLLVALAGGASAQTVRDSASLRPDDRAAVPDSSVASPVDDGQRHVLLSVLDWLKGADDAGARAATDRRWLGRTALAMGLSGSLARPASPAPAGGRKISRTYIAIPMVQWQGYSSLVAQRGYVSITPSIVIGRRPTWAPELARGGRTFGIGVQMRIWLDRPAQPTLSGPAPNAQDRIVSTLRGLLDRRTR